MDWHLIWEFAGVVVPSIALLGGFLYWLVSSQTSALTKEFTAAIALMNTAGSAYSHALESRIHANETDISQFKERLGILEVRQAQTLLMQAALEKFGDKLDTVATKLAVVADRLNRVNGHKDEE